MYGKMTKSDLLHLIFRRFHVPVSAWSMLETRYKNMFSYCAIKNSSSIFLGEDPLLSDLHKILNSNLFWSDVNEKK